MHEGESPKRSNALNFDVNSVATALLRRGALFNPFVSELFMKRVVFLVLVVVAAACGVPSSVDAGSPVSCDPLGAACADSSQGCYPVGDGTRAICATPGTIGHEGACSNVLGDPPECVRNNICLNVATGTVPSRSCAQFCNLDGGAPRCGTGTCQHASGAAFGVCL